MDLELGDKVVVVTGGSSGLGAALVLALVAEGARVAFCARNAQEVQALVDEIAASGREVLGVPVDVTETGDLERFVATVIKRWGRIDALVNNAGSSSAVRFDEQTEATWDDDLDLKLRAAIRLIRLVLPHLRAAGGGNILNILNILARAPDAESTPTSVSRAAGLALTKALSKELGPELIRVNAILIGWVRSGQWERWAAAEGIAVDDLYARLGSGRGIPLGRVGRAEEFADLGAFLLSARSSYITGVAINFDGGASPIS